MGLATAAEIVNEVANVIVAEEIEIAAEEEIVEIAVATVARIVSNLKNVVSGQRAAYRLWITPAHRSVSGHLRRP